MHKFSIGRLEIYSDRILYDGVDITPSNFPAYGGDLLFDEYAEINCENKIAKLRALQDYIVELKAQLRVYGHDTESRRV